MTGHSQRGKRDADLTLGIRIALGCLLALAAVTVIAALLYATGVRL